MKEMKLKEIQEPNPKCPNCENNNKIVHVRKGSLFCNAKIVYECPECYARYEEIK